MHSDWQQFLTQQGARIEAGAVTGFASLDDERMALRTGTVICDLSHLGLILASGEEAAAFLHGQVTNDVQALADDAVQLNGYCSPKGRLLATFLLWRARQGLLLQLPGELAEPIRKRLSMFVLRAKVKLEDVSDRWIRIGLAGTTAEAQLRALFGAAPSGEWTNWHGTWQEQGVRVLRLPQQRFEIVTAPEGAAAIWTALAAQATPAGRWVWDWLAIQAGIPAITLKTQETFVPQMVNFELLGGVSFRKGCYPGQEIVARTQYRGILKRRMALGHTASAALPKAGDVLFSAAFGDQAAGEIVNAAPAPDGGFDVLFVAQLDALRAAAFRLHNPDGEVLQLTRLPYPADDLPDTSTAA